MRLFGEPNMTDDQQEPQENYKLPKGFKLLVGGLLLTISIGVMSIWGVFA